MTEPGTPDGAPAPDRRDAPTAPEPAHATESAPPKAKAADLDLIEPDVPSKSLLSRLNPSNLFQKETPARLVKQGRDAERNRNYAQATVAFNRALSLDPDYAPAFEALGDVLVKKGGRSNLNAAIEQFQQAAVRNPHNERVYAMLSKAYDALGMRKEAALEKKKLVVVKTLEKDPKNPAANNNMGILYLQQKRVAEALDYFGRAVDSDSRYDTGLRNLAITYFRLANEATDSAKAEAYLEKSTGYINRALDAARSPLSLITHARILIMEGSFEQALQVCEEAEAMDPALKDVFGLKKTILLELNRLEEANAAYETYRFLSANE